MVRVEKVGRHFHNGSLKGKEMNDPSEGFPRGNYPHPHFQLDWGCGKARDSRIKLKA